MWTISEEHNCWCTSSWAWLGTTISYPASVFGLVRRILVVIYFHHILSGNWYYYYFYFFSNSLWRKLQVLVLPGILDIHIPAIHRLDRLVSGLLIIARTASKADTFRQQVNKFGFIWKLIFCILIENDLVHQCFSLILIEWLIDSKAKTITSERYTIQNKLYDTPKNGPYKKILNNDIIPNQPEKRIIYSFTM